MESFLRLFWYREPGALRSHWVLFPHDRAQFRNAVLESINAARARHVR